VPDFNAALDDDIGDDFYASCSILHPVLRLSAPLANATLARWPDHRRNRPRVSRPEPTVAQRIVRAKEPSVRPAFPLRFPAP